MHIYLKHPVHGTKVAISQHEADDDVMNGWEQFDPFNIENEKTELINHLRRKRKPNPESNDEK